MFSTIILAGLPFLVTLNLNYCLSLYSPDATASFAGKTPTVNVGSITGHGFCAGLGFTPKFQLRNTVREALTTVKSTEAQVTSPAFEVEEIQPEVTP